MTDELTALQAALNGYEIGARLGAGTFGVVFAARQPLLGRQVALKVLRSDHAASAELKGRFRTEATVLAELDHPHIVKVFEYHEVNDLCVLVMERLDGGDLRGRLGRAPIDVPTACTVALAACSALQQAHLQSVLHRDIKPANLMFSAAGILKITDFGIAKVLAGMQPGTVMDSFLGTPSYVAPEQVSGDALGPGVDIYAVATLLYELLSGQLPHPAGGGPMAVAFRHVTDPPRPLGEVAPELPTALIEAVMRGLARSPADRYESAEAFGIAIARAAAELGPRWHTRARVSLAAPGPILEELLAPSPAPSPDQAGQTAIWSRASSPTDPAADPALAGSTELWPTPTIPIAQLPAPEPAPEPAPPALPVAEPEPAPPAVPIAQPPAAAPAAVPPAASPPVAPPPARRRTLIAGLAALVAVAAGGTIYALTGSSDKNTASVISSGGTTTSPTSNSSGSPDFANVLSSEGSGVLRVISDSCSTGHSGTGFLIAPNLVATASSLLTDTVSVSVSTADHQVRAGQVIGFDSDLALIELAHNLTGHVFSPGSVPTANDPLAAIGYAPADGPVLRNAVLATVDHDRFSLQSSSEFSATDLGAPVLGSSGELAGILLSTDSSTDAVLSASAAAAKAQAWIDSPQHPDASSCATSAGPDGEDMQPGVPDSAAATAAISTTVANYFRAVDQADYPTAYQLLGTSLQAALGSLDQFSTGHSTTFDFNVTLHSVTREGSDGSLRAWVTFTSLQSADHGPKPGQTCSNWSLDYIMQASSGSYLINRVLAHTGSTPSTGCL